MSWSIPFAEKDIDLATDRIPAKDGARQMRTAQEILSRLRDQPGLILADEVGMGKTFVALAVSASVVLARKKRYPVVVMVPTALRDKWPREAEVFREKCLSPRARKIFTTALATDGVQFFKLLDDPPERRKAVVFLTHSALTRGLNDPWVKLALIRATFQRRKSLRRVRRAFPRMASRLLWLRGYGLSPDQYERLLEEHPHRWHKLLTKFGVELDDDPVPEALLEKIRAVDRRPIVEALLTLPLHTSPNIEARMNATRVLLSKGISQIWRDWLGMTESRSPLLILDEAHHFKNPSTRQASLFQDGGTDGYAEMVAGPLEGVFERMLFLTATPFQLGHQELIAVLKHFRAIRWRKPRAPEAGKDAYLEQIHLLGEALNEAQLSALRLEKVWGRLEHADLNDVKGLPVSVDDWWQGLSRSKGQAESPLASQIWQQYQSTKKAIAQAGRLLKPWVIRHNRGVFLPGSKVARRIRLEGAAIASDEPLPVDHGLEVEGSALLPFLLAARASVAHETLIRLKKTRSVSSVFAEGLASSYESYLHSRRKADGRDVESAIGSSGEVGFDDELKWYLTHLDRVLPVQNPETRLNHPKVTQTVQRALELWESGEKVVVFCHFIATGKALREHISRQMGDWVRKRAMEQFEVSDPEVAERRLDNLSDYFFKEEGLRPVVTDELNEIVRGVPGLAESERGGLVAVVRRFVRTPTFLIRYFPLDDRDRVRAFKASLDRPDASGQTLREQIRNLCHFLANRCTESERLDYLQALDSIQTGRIRGSEVAQTFAPDEEADGSERLMPNVRFVFGATKFQTRKTLMLAFNTPLFPEILISSSVLAEGVDLHLDCRHVIHHDLDWNPSTLEQRTGRIDRLGAKAELTGKPIRVYLPYVAGTHDEKQFRVVMDRERWFQVVMGEKMALDELSTERISERVPLPREAAKGLAMKLGLDDVPSAS